MTDKCISQRFSLENTLDLYRNVFWKLMIMHNLNFITVDFTAQIKYFIVRVAIFEPSYLSQNTKVFVLIRLEIF